ncbi:sperm flagellar protein 1 isoform X3 [Larus michahellis]|uniref:sperm flagellar protein 1 isoform X3 n=1 Tax=Larus michahellis TaxID=119627 RepID=UPI003D9AD5A8
MPCRFPGHAGTSPETSATGCWQPRWSSSSSLPWCSCTATCLPVPRRRNSLTGAISTVLSKLNFSVPDDVIQQVVQCRPGTVEQVLLLLRQKIDEKQRQSKVVPGPGQEQGVRAALEEVSYLETGYSKAKGGMGGSYAQESPRAAGVMKSYHGCAQASPGDTAVRQQLAEREQALLLAQETIQILQLKVGRLEQLLHLKNVRIDDLSRRLQEAQCPQR